FWNLHAKFQELEGMLATLRRGKFVRDLQTAKRETVDDVTPSADDNKLLGDVDTVLQELNHQIFLFALNDLGAGRRASALILHQDGPLTKRKPPPVRAGQVLGMGRHGAREQSAPAHDSPQKASGLSDLTPKRHRLR